MDLRAPTVSTPRSLPVAGRTVRADQGPPPGAARREPGRQRRSGKVVHEVDPGRSGLLRREQRRRQHRRDREVPERRGAGLAVDRRRRVPRRDVPTSRCAPCVHLPRARRRRRRLARGARQRRARRAWARRSSTTPSTPSAGCATSPTSPRARATRRPRRWATDKAADLRGALRRGVVVRPDARPVRRLARGPRQRAGLPAALDRRHPGRGRAACGPARPDWPARPARPRGRALVEKREEPCYTGEFGLFHTGTGRDQRPDGNPGPPATRRCPRSRPSGRSSR